MVIKVGAHVVVVVVLNVMQAEQHLLLLFL